MINPYFEYYVNQAGSGLTAFEGIQYQRGHGFFGSLFTNILKPLGKFLGRHALSTGVRVGKDILDNKNLADSVKENLMVSGKEMWTDGVNRVQKYIQTGKGRKRRRTKSKVSIKRKARRKIKPQRKRKPKTKVNRRKKRKCAKKRVTKKDFYKLLN